MTKLQLLNKLFNQYRDEGKVEEMKLIQEMIHDQSKKSEPNVLRLG